MKKQDILKMETVAVFGLCNVGGIEIKSVDDEKTVYETGTIRSYDCLNAMFWDQISGGETEISIVPEEEYAEQWLDFACEEWVNARHDMTEAERNCFINLMSSCLETMW